SKSIDILKVMYKERLPLYKKYADISVYNNGINECAENLIAEYKNNILRKI
ncbi:MAG TPA: shikimate dehydrogenase, partial [Candidatus Fimicola cottocaccae]|nr:shikimate dehydrogenase [Candidatus Fimicola cottocaccae]